MPKPTLTHETLDLDKIEVMEENSKKSYMCEYSAEILFDPIEIFMPGSTCGHLINRTFLKKWEEQCKTHNQTFTHPITGEAVLRKKLKIVNRKDIKKNVDEATQDINNHNPELLKEKYSLETLTQLYDPKEFVQHYGQDLVLSNFYTPEQLALYYNPREFAQHYNHGIKKLSKYYSLHEIATCYNPAVLAPYYKLRELTEHYSLNDLSKVYSQEDLSVFVDNITTQDSTPIDIEVSKHDEVETSLVEIIEEPNTAKQTSKLITVYVVASQDSNKDLFYYAKSLAIGDFKVEAAKSNKFITIELEVIESEHANNIDILRFNIAGNNKQRFEFQAPLKAIRHQTQIELNPSKEIKNKLEEIANYETSINTTTESSFRNELKELQKNAQAELWQLAETSAQGCLKFNINLANREEIKFYRNKLNALLEYKNKKIPSQIVEEIRKKPIGSRTFDEHKYFAAETLFNKLDDKLNTLIETSNKSLLDKEALAAFGADVDNILRSDEAKLLEEHSNYAKVILANVGISCIPIIGIPLLISRVCITAFSKQGVRLFFDTTKGRNQVEGLKNSAESISTINLTPNP